MSWTRNLLIWSQTRYHCATEPDQLRALAFSPTLIALIFDLIIIFHVLSKWFRSGLNRGPHACEACVITTTLRNRRALFLISNLHNLNYELFDVTNRRRYNGSARVWTEDLLRVKQTWWPLHYETWTLQDAVFLEHHQRTLFHQFFTTRLIMER